MATARPTYFCHKCQTHIGHILSQDYECPQCHDSFIEEVSPSQTTQPQSNPRRAGGAFQFHGSSPYGNTTIYFGGGPSTNNVNDGSGNLEMGHFLENVLTQLATGLNSGIGAGFPWIMHNAGLGQNIDANNLDAFLTQFLNQMGENSGPAPAPENRINSIPTVKVTADQARDNLQCAICMDDFKENDDAKRLPCSHHFHEECIKRWLRLHGTCPTCRVPLDGENTTNQDFFNRNTTQQSSNDNNRRNDRGNNGSSASNGGFEMLEFD